MRSHTRDAHLSVVTLRSSSAVERTVVNRQVAVFDPCLRSQANAIIANAVKKTVRMVTRVPDHIQGWRGGSAPFK